MENEQTDGDENNSIRENVPKQFERKFCHRVGDWHRARQHHGDTQIFPGAHPFRFIRLAVVFEFTCPFKFGNGVQNLLRVGDDLFGRTVFRDGNGHDGSIKYTVGAAVLTALDVPG